MSIDDLERLGFFRFVPAERLAAVREECRRELDGGMCTGLAFVEGLGRFGRADAESLSEQGMASAIADLGQLLALRRIEARQLPTSDVYVSIAGGPWLIVDDEIATYDAEGMRDEIEECVVRVGAERFSLMHEPGNSWRPSSRALCHVLRRLLAQAGSEESAFSYLPGENDHTVFFGTAPMAKALGLELWPELDGDPGLHVFHAREESPFGESDLREVQRFQRVDDDLSAAIELATENGYTNPYSTREVIRVRPGGSPETVDAGSPEAAAKLVRELHNALDDGGRTIAQAAARRR
ncbi:MAG: hypothetical protein U0270_35545 [Labilithrix sp.]